MSTKIYNGYKIKNMKFSELNDFCMNIRQKIHEEAHKIVLKQIARECAEIVDNIFTKRFNQIPANYREKTEYSVYYAARSISLERIEKNKTFTCSFVLYPHGRNILCTFHSRNENFESIFSSTEGVEEYGYWNNTDKPENISEKQWRKRQKDWDKVFTRNPLKGCEYIPSLTGLMCDIINSDILYLFYSLGTKDDLKLIIENMPDFNKRLEALAHDMALGDLVQEELGPDINTITSRDFVNVFYKATDNIRNTEKGKSLVEKYKQEVREKIPEKITEEHLSLIILKEEKGNKDEETNQGQTKL